MEVEGRRRNLEEEEKVEGIRKSTSVNRGGMRKELNGKGCTSMYVSTFSSI